MTNPKMQRAHFSLIAQVLHNHAQAHPTDHNSSLVKNFSSALHYTNPMFNHNKFTTAATPPDPPPPPDTSLFK